MNFFYCKVNIYYMKPNYVKVIVKITLREFIYNFTYNYKFILNSYW